MIYLNILLISAILVFVLDLSGFVQYWENKIYKWTFGVYPSPSYDFTEKPLIKLISCSLCQTIWISLFYLLYIHELTLIHFAYVCLIAFLTPITKDILIWVKDTLQTLINLIYRLTTR